MATVIKNGLAVDPEWSRPLDIRIENGVIAELGENLPTDGCDVEDAEGCLVFPGFVDGSTAFEQDGGVTATADDLESGTRAELAGGTTTFIDTACQQKGEKLAAALEARKRRAEGRCSCDYATELELSEWNDDISAELAELDGAAGFSVRTEGAGALREGELFRLMKRFAELGLPLGVYCSEPELTSALENDCREKEQFDVAFYPSTRPDAGEAAATARALYLAGLAGARLVIKSVSCAASLEEIHRARKAGQSVAMETCPQYLTLDSEEYAKGGFAAAKFVCDPPLRGESDINALWEAARRADVDFISSAHRSYNFGNQKIFGARDFTKIPAGLPTAENRVVLVYNYGMLDGRITENQMAAMMSANPAKQAGLYPRKGSLSVGADADIVVWDRHRRVTLSQKTQSGRADYCPWEGLKLEGAPAAVYLRGELVARYGVVISECRGTALSPKLK